MVSANDGGMSSPTRWVHAEGQAGIAQPDQQPVSIPSPAEALGADPEPPVPGDPESETTEPEEAAEPAADAPDPEPEPAAAAPGPETPLTAESDPVAFDELVADATVADLTAAIEAGTLDLAAVVASEQRGKQRKGILSLAPDTDPEAS